MMFDDMARFVLDPQDIPEPALDFGATLFFDTLGVAAGATLLTVGKIVRDHAVRFHGAPDPKDAAPLLFDGRMASIPGAAFALASQIDNLDGHDGLNLTKGHIGCAVVPALCAFAHTRPDLTMREATEALVMSYEVSARAAIALHATVSDYHTSGAWNALGVAALGARLRGATADQLRQALGIAEYHGPRSQMMREIANPTMLHDGSGMGALVGSMAILLAEQGFTGAPAITVEAMDVAPTWADLGQDWTIERNYIKPYPICRWAHAALDALGDLIDAHDLTPDNVARIDVATFAEAAELFPGRPQTTSQAQYAMHFPLAVRLMHGQVGPEHVAESGLGDPKASDIIDRIHVREEPRHSQRFPAGRWSDVAVTTTDGQRFVSGDVEARGGPEGPLSMDDIADKFRRFSAPLGAERSAAIWRYRDLMCDPDRRFVELLHLLVAAPEVD